MFLKLAIAAVIVTAAPSFVLAQNYPTRPVRIIIGNAPGGGTDTVGRAVAAQLTDRLKTSFFVENQGGASGLIAMEAARKAQPDGSVLLLAGNSLLTRMALKKIDFDVLKAY